MMEEEERGVEVASYIQIEQEEEEEEGDMGFSLFD